MRSLDQCRAEVFARSEKRIKKRRKIRGRMAAALTPICLCAVLAAALPIMSGPNKSAPMENAECAGEPEYGAAHSDSQRATVIGKNGERWNLSESQTKQLTCLLDSYLLDGVQTESQMEPDYEIEIDAEDGTVIRYLFSGSRLTCSGLTAALTESERLQILDLLQPASE